jgi:uncharacterized repeat protein (TIGR03803 family)
MTCAADTEKFIAVLPLFDIDLRYYVERYFVSSASWTIFYEKRHFYPRFGLLSIPRVNGGRYFPVQAYASTPTILVSFCPTRICTDGAIPAGGLVADANGNLFGTTQGGGAYVPIGFGAGTVSEIAKTASGYASTPTTLVSFAPPGTNGATPFAGLIADANGNLFGTTAFGGAYGYGTVFEITGSGFVVSVTFAGTPGTSNCHGRSVSALAHQYGGLNAAAAALGYSDVSALQNAIIVYCGR